MEIVFGKIWSKVFPHRMIDNKNADCVIKSQKYTPNLECIFMVAGGGIEPPTSGL